MAVVYNGTLKTQRMQNVVDAIDAGAGPGYIEIGTAGMASVLATLELADPSFTVAGDTMTMAGTPRADTSADESGSAAAARIKDSDGNVVVSGLTVGTSGANVIVTNTTIEAGDEVRIVAGAIVHG